ncbi:putative soluble epoxide hydrolase [Helianthus annuus]|nr:putative soluble epoxide hydrolase [Helianthus annuus]
MDKISHRFLQVNGLKLHVAEIGSEPAPAVIFLHGFPEIWYTWRHQMIAVANAGFRAIAPDYRGYGLSDPPAEPDKASYDDFVNDIVSILDRLAISKWRWIWLGDSAGFPPELVYGHYLLISSVLNIMEKHVNNTSQVSRESSQRHNHGVRHSCQLDLVPFRMYVHDSSTEFFRVEELVVMEREERRFLE